jgi:hypothetical protein
MCVDSWRTVFTTKQKKKSQLWGSLHHPETE